MLSFFQSNDFLKTFKSFFSCKENKGATAIEFALVFLPFLYIIFAIVEFGLLFFAQNNLNSLLMTSSRQLRTGQFQKSGNATQQEYKRIVCQSLPKPMNCQNLYFDVVEYTSFRGRDPNRSPFLTDGTFDENRLQFNPAKPGAIMTVHLYYKWKLFTPFVGTVLANSQDKSSYWIVSGTAFRREP